MHHFAYRAGVKMTFVPYKGGAAATQDVVSGVADLRIDSIPTSKPFIESGNVFLPEWTDWLDGFISESNAFPSGAHDDQMDPMFDAVADIQAAPALPSKAPVSIPKTVMVAGRR